jgi:hypothetical protein
MANKVGLEKLMQMQGVILSPRQYASVPHAINVSDLLKD